jgi:hypothetical protein
MIDPDRWKELDTTLTDIVRRYGPWAVLWRTTEVLRPAFLLLDKAGPPKPKQPRKKKRTKDAEGDR